MTLLIHQGPLALFAAFVVMHALADFPLQGEYLSHNKVRKQADDLSRWVVSLTAHCVIQGGGVWLVSGSLGLGLVEVALHGLIDLAKGEGITGLATDQLLHLACKLGYVAVLVGTFG